MVSDLEKHILVDGFQIVIDLEKSRGCRIHDSVTGRDLVDLYGFFGSMPVGFNHPHFDDPAVQRDLLLAARTKVANSDVYTTLFWRSLLGGLSVLAAQALLNKRHDLAGLWSLTAPEWWMALASSGAMVCFIAAFFFAPVADVVFIYSAFPIITLLLSAALLHTVVRPIDVLCTATVVLGMGLIVWGQSSLHSLMGAALSLAATLLFALITIGIKRYPQAEMVKVTYAGAFGAALLLTLYQR